MGRSDALGAGYPWAHADHPSDPSSAWLHHRPDVRRLRGIDLGRRAVGDRQLARAVIRMILDAVPLIGDGTAPDCRRRLIRQTPAGRGDLRW